MIWKTLHGLLFFAVIVLTLVFSACSKAKEPEKEATDARPTTQQAKEAIQDYGRRPVNKAREAHGMGDERTKGIDEAVGKMDRP